MTPENKHATSNEIEQVPPSPMPPDHAVVTLVRVGTRRCRLAAAFMAVVVGLASQIGIQSVAQAKQSTLYLDAPAVSTERASRAGDASSAYSTDSPVSSEILAWLGLPAQSVHFSSLSEGAEQAFSSITASNDDEAGGVTIAAALRAGKVMLAQIEGSPSEDGGAESASAGAVRPQLGNGNLTPEAEPEPDAPEDALEEQPNDAGSTSDTGAQAYASTPGASASGGEPSSGPGIVVPAPVDKSAPDDGSQQAPPAEIVSAPSDTRATPTPDSGMDEESYEPAEPVSNTGRAPTSAATGSPEDGDDGGEQPSPDEGVPASEQNAVSNTGEGERAEAEPTVEETGPTSGEGGRSILVPVSPLSIEEETTTTEGDTEPVDDPSSAVPPADADGADPASVESTPPEETPEDNSTGTETPSVISTEPSADELGEAHVEIVVVVEGAPQTESPAETPPEQPTMEELPTGQARPEDVSPSEVSPVREPSDGYAPSEGGTPQDDDTEQGQSPFEEEPSEEEPAEQPPAREEPAAEQPDDAPPDEEQPAADGEPPSTGGPGAGESAPVAPLEDLRPNGERPEDQEDVAIPLPDGALSENPNDTSEEEVAPPSDDQVPGNPREGGRDERQEEDLQKEDGPQAGEGGPAEALPSYAGEQVEENGGRGEPVQEKPQDLAAAPEEGGAIQQEQTVIVEVGGDLTPELPAQDAPRMTEEPVAADPVPQAAQVSAPTRTEEPTAQQHAAEQAQADQRSAPEPATVDRTHVPEDAGDSPKDGSRRQGGSSGDTQKP